LDKAIFRKIGDFSPNSESVDIALSFKKDLHMAYVEEQKRINYDFVDYSKFIGLWNVLYPHFSTRLWLNVPGKCWLFSEIDSLRRGSGDSSVLEALQQLHLLHRGGFIMPERSSYKSRKVKATENTDTIFSCILDGMDQSHSQIPHLGTQDSFGDPLKQHIQGVLVHGKGKYSLSYYYYLLLLFIIIIIIIIII
jgi:hypothetical protein